MAAPTYATIAQIKTHIDTRLIEMLTSDDGTDGALDSYANNTTLGAAVERASSDVESYARRGQRYSDTDLVALQTAGDTTLIGLVADLTVFHLANRRGGDITPAIQARGQDAHRTLKAMANGDRIFAMDSGAEGSGTATASVISATTRAELDMVSDSEFFPVTQDRLF